MFLILQVKSEERVFGKVEVEAKSSRYSYPKQVFLIQKKISTRLFQLIFDVAITVSSQH